MAWIILEGLDRTGKTSVAELYKRQGYELVHFKAPDKKYSQPGYTGPSYLDEVLEMYMAYNGRDVIFDRSLYGEFVWPFVYNRKAQLTDDEIEVLQEIEDSNYVERYLMYDFNTEVHWKRCVDNNEPLTRSQFNQANLLFDKMARKYNFTKKQLSEFSELQKSVTADLSQKSEVKVEKDGSAPVSSSNPVDSKSNQQKVAGKPSELVKLEKANAINDVLAKRIIKQKGDMYDALEKEVRDFLHLKLSTIFGDDVSSSFSNEEVQILKIYCKQLRQKLEAKK